VQIKSTNITLTTETTQGIETILVENVKSLNKSCLHILLKEAILTEDKAHISSKESDFPCFPQALVSFVENPTTEFLGDAVLQSVRRAFMQRSNKNGIRIVGRYALCFLIHSGELQNLCHYLNATMYFVPTGRQLANGQFAYEVRRKDGKNVIINTRKYPEFFWTIGGRVKNRLHVRMEFYYVLNYWYAFSLQEAGRIHDKQTLLRYMQLVYAGMEADYHLQHMDSHHVNCNPRCQFAYVSGNNTSRRSSCYRHFCTCDRTHLCISSCGCEACYANLPASKRMSLAERKMIDRQIFQSEEITFSQLTSVGYDDAFDNYDKTRGSTGEVNYASECDSVNGKSNSEAGKNRGMTEDGLRCSTRLKGKNVCYTEEETDDEL
jgi:hypothetical protein